MRITVIPESAVTFIKLKSSFLIASIAITFVLALVPGRMHAEDGYRMWLRYDRIANPEILHDYRTRLSRIMLDGDSPTIHAAGKELERGLSGLLDAEVTITRSNHSHQKLVRETNREKSGVILIGTPESSPAILSLGFDEKLESVGNGGFLIEHVMIDGEPAIIIAANEDIGVLYGVFHLLRMLQTYRELEGISFQSAPRIQYRIANHWDDLNRNPVRGYAGISLWEWGTLPEYRHPRYTDYARFQASIGINAVALNNVNADPRILTDQFLEKVSVLADIFRPYGIQVFLSVNFYSPKRLGGLDTADPLDSHVIQWWKDKADIVYTYIPDFGGFLVKADSEGQPGPHGYGRTHAEGANMLADALRPHDGVVMWRAFVYEHSPEDRIREAYDEFAPLDGKFADNVIIQVKNGPLDFQPREPFTPLFGGMPQSNTMMEFQISQEYFGFANHLAYKGPVYTEVLNADTHAKGEGSTVGRVIDGSVFDYSLTGMAGVINPGTDRNWTGHPFVQSSWYAFGRLAWDHTIPAEAIAEEWIRMTFGNDERLIEPIRQIMMVSREAAVNYRVPIGLTHNFDRSHYHPEPWHSGRARADWNSDYFHRADEDGIGFDRTESGTNAVEQYHEPVAEIFSDIDRIPEKYLLWFHRVGWDHPMKSGRTLWEELVYKYYKGVEQVRWIRDEWDLLEGMIDQPRFEHVRSLLSIQEEDAVRWRNVCVTYFQSRSGLPIPDHYEKPDHDLDYYKNLIPTLYIPSIDRGWSF